MKELRKDLEDEKFDPWKHTSKVNELEVRAAIKKMKKKKAPGPNKITNEFWKNGEKVQDKEGVVVNQENNEIYVTWTQFDSYGTTIPTDSSVILFSKFLIQYYTFKVLY